MYFITTRTYVTLSNVDYELRVHFQHCQEQRCWCSASAWGNVWRPRNGMRRWLDSHKSCCKPVKRIMSSHCSPKLWSIKHASSTVFNKTLWKLCIPRRQAVFIEDQWFYPCTHSWPMKKITFEHRKFHENFEAFRSFESFDERLTLWITGWTVVQALC